ncbi:MAG TPA: metallophosphoesterase [Aliidiomarina sp.]|nr:metallophosphoesterase [Aliidiomarina sp.]
MYDIIGDVHGYASRLEALLKELGYNKQQGVWRHSERILISVGDLVDRGPEQRETVNIIRNMQEAGQALAIMGNHEYNAVGWVMKDVQGNYLRPHTDRNRSQHEAFLQACEGHKNWYKSTIEWFKSLPVYLDLPDLRVVHACWHGPSKEILDQHTDSSGALLEEAWPLSGDKRNPLHQALEILSKGWEVDLPEGYSFFDKDSHERFKIRTQWWREDGRTYRDLAIGVDDMSRLPTTEIDGAALPGYDNEKPLFLGHYWMRGKPHLQSRYIACVDWTVVEPGGLMAAYRFDGEQQLCDSKFVAV